MAGRRTFRILTSSQQSGIYSKKKTAVFIHCMRNVQIFFSEGLKGRVHLEDLGVDGSIILTWNFIEWTEHNGISV